MSTFHPATSSLANFKNTVSTISTSGFFVYISRQEPTFVMASQIELFLPANSYTTHLLSSTRATNEGIARGFGGVVNFPSLLSAYWVLSAYFLAVLQISAYAY